MLQPGSVSTLRVANRSRILRLIAGDNTVSRTELAAETGLKPPSVTRIVRELIDLGLVVDEHQNQIGGGLGRRRTGVRVRPDGAYVLGFALNASGMSVGIAGADGVLIDQIRIEGEARLDPDDTLTALSEAAHTLIVRHAGDVERVLGAAVACAGEVNSTTGVLNTSMALGWQNVEVVRAFAEALQIPVLLENLNVSLLEAARLNDPETRNRHAILVRTANGIMGSAFLIDGSVLRNSRSKPSWIGHHPARGVDLGCFCGQRGCLNTVASAPAMLAAYDEGETPAQFSAADFVKNEERIRQLVLAAEAGEEKAVAVLKEGGVQLGRFLVPQVVSFGVDMIQIAGFVGRSKAYLAGVKSGFEDSAPPETIRNVTIAANSMTLVQSAIHVALNRFVYSQALDVTKLSQTGALNDRESVDAA